MIDVGSKDYSSFSLEILGTDERKEGNKGGKKKGERGAQRERI